jgi:hypothetical protein
MGLLAHCVTQKQVNVNATKIDMVKRVVIVYQAFMDHHGVKSANATGLARYVIQLARVLIVKETPKEITVKGNY